MTEVATQLAQERTFLATERTLMAWIRTALSMISFGFTIGKLGEVVESVPIPGLLRLHEYSISGLAYTLVTMGTVALLIACVQHWGEVRKLRQLGFRPPRSLAFLVAVLLALLGALAFSALVLRI